MTPKTQIFDIGDEKKHSVRYEERGDPSESDAETLRNSVTGTLYVRKSALGSLSPRPEAHTRGVHNG